MPAIHLPALVRRQLETLEDVDRGLVVAVSGGADSVALARAVVDTATGRPIALAHLNHQLRADASDADEAFVVELHARLCATGVPNLHCVHQRRDVGAEARELGANLEA